MRLGQLSDKLETHNSTFVSKLIKENLDDVNTLKEIRDRLKEIMSESDIYAEDNSFKYKYIQMAQEPLWTGINIEPAHFIYQGFDAYVSIDLTENLDTIVPYVVIHNNNVIDLKDGQRIEITPEFKDGLNPLQKEIFEEALGLVENRTVKTLKKVWSFEKDRMNKWVRTCEIKLKGNN